MSYDQDDDPYDDGDDDIYDDDSDPLEDAEEEVVGPVFVQLNEEIIISKYNK
jgi:hypothetical protein